jgi:putative membrane protein
MSTNLLIALVALEHLWFATLEIFLWRKPLGLKAFQQTAESAEKTAVMAMNQGLYNAFLASGLIWSLLAEPPFSFHLKLFFLGCVAAAGIFGAMTALRQILWIQGVPAILALIFLFLS